MQTALASLALGPQTSEPDLEIRHLVQGLRVELAEARTAVLTDCAVRLVLACERLLTSHAGLRLLRELHQATEGRGCDGDGTGVFARKQLACLLLTEDGFEDTAQRVCELVIEVVFCVDGDVVFENVERIL